jgi:uncharacterized SAM-binding protein YcdF (DUF218 family)
VILIVLLAIALRVGTGAIALARTADAPVDTILVVGGSVRRELHAIERVRQHPEWQVLISRGSGLPCLRGLFERAQVPVARVWVERCARSTFGNFFYSVPILKRWGSRRVRLIDSGSHVMRALWMARIALGVEGIWVESDPASEVGVPGNRESRIKTVLDVTRTAAWAVVSPLLSRWDFPQCAQVVPLRSVDLDAACDRNALRCEHQADMKSYCQERRSPIP